MLAFTVSRNQLKGIMPGSASFSSFSVSFHWGTRKLSVFIFTEAGKKREQEDSQSVVEITVNCYIGIF